MIPKLYATGFTPTPVKYPGLTWELDYGAGRAMTRIDGLAAVRQAAWKILTTERYAHLIYGDDYGVGLQKYIGKSMPYVKADAPREIREGLLYDDRIVDVKNFKMHVSAVDALCVAFDVVTTEGAYREELVIHV